MLSPEKRKNWFFLKNNGSAFDVLCCNSMSSTGCIVSDSHALVKAWELGVPWKSREPLFLHFLSSIFIFIIKTTKYRLQAILDLDCINCCLNLLLDYSLLFLV